MQPDSTAGDDAYVVSSRVAIASERGDQLLRAFQDRLRLVEGAPGFQCLELLLDIARPGVFPRAWWSDVARFRECMRTVDHRVSHLRSPSGPECSRGTRLRQYRRVRDLGVLDDG